MQTRPAGAAARPAPRASASAGRRWMQAREWAAAGAGRRGWRVAGASVQAHSPVVGGCSWAAAHGTSRGCRWCAAARGPRAAHSWSSAGTTAAISSACSCVVFGRPRRRRAAGSCPWRRHVPRRVVAARTVRRGARRSRHCRRAPRPPLPPLALYARSLRSLRIELHFPNLFHEGTHRNAARRTRLIRSCEADENPPQSVMAAKRLWLAISEKYTLYIFFLFK